MGEIRFKTGTFWASSVVEGRVDNVEEAKQKVHNLAEAMKAINGKTKISAIYRERLI